MSYLINEGFKPRPYQKDIINKALEIIESSKTKAPRFIINLETGGGKTSVACMIFKELIERKIITHQTPALVSTYETYLLNQLNENLERSGVVSFPLSRERSIVRTYAFHQTTQSLTNKIERIGKEPTTLSRISAKRIKHSVILFDECHGHVEQQMEIVRNNPDAIVIGLSATPISSENSKFELGHLYQEIISGPSRKELIASGYLSGFVNPLVPFEKSLDKTETADIVAQYLEHRLDEFGQHRQTLIAEKDIASAERTYQAFLDAGIPVGIAHSKNKDSQDAIKKFKDEKLPVIVQVSMVLQGVDLPCAKLLILNCKKGSFKEYWQLLGRTLRVYNNQKSLIIDNMGTIQSMYNEYGVWPDSTVKYELTDKIRMKTREKGGYLCGGFYNGLTCGQEFDKDDGKCPTCGWLVPNFENAKTKEDTRTEIKDLILVEKDIGHFSDEFVTIKSKALMTSDKTADDLSYSVIEEERELAASMEGLSLPRLKTLLCEDSQKVRAAAAINPKLTKILNNIIRGENNGNI